MDYNSSQLKILLEDKLTTVVKLHDIEDIQGLKHAKFLSPRDYIVKKDMRETFLHLLKHNYHSYKYPNRGISYSIDLYFVFPIFSKKTQALVAWVGVDFHESTDSYWRKGELKKAVTDSITESYDKINNLSVDKIYYLEFLADESVNDGFKAAVRKSPLKTNDDPIVFRGGYQPLKNRLAEDLANFVVALVISILIWFTLVALFIRDDTKEPPN